MKCCYVDERRDFFSVLGEKLGEEYQLEAAEADDRGRLTDCDAILVGLPGVEHARFPACLNALKKIVSNVEAAPVVAMVSSADRHGMRLAIAAGAYDCFVEAGSMEELRIVLRRKTA